MESALIVTRSEKGLEHITEALRAASVWDIAVSKTCGEARRAALERSFDLVVVNAPLADESGEGFSRQVASEGISQVILLVRAELMEAVSAACEADGVLTVSKPINKSFLWAALKLAAAARNRLRRMQAENDRLRKKIEDIRVIDRAKCLLVSHLGMSEEEAHRHIEKQAMDSRAARRSVAEEILKKYGN
jgi:response regulator NasT